MSKVVWIGLAEVVAAKPGATLGSGEGAYVHMLARATDSEEFEAVIGAYLRQDNLTVVSLEDAETLDDRIAYGHISDELLELASTLDEQTPVAAGTFEVFDLEV